MPERCEITDLLAEQCAHCRKLPDPLPRQIGQPFTAAYAGRCVDCDTRFEPGDSIRRDLADGAYVGPCCAVPP